MEAPSDGFLCLPQSDFYYNCFQTFKNFKMDEEITCAICQKSLDNVNDVVTLREKGSEGINQASKRTQIPWVCQKLRPPRNSDPPAELKTQSDP